MAWEAGMQLDFYEIRLPLGEVAWVRAIACDTHTSTAAVSWLDCCQAGVRKVREASRRG